MTRIKRHSTSDLMDEWLESQGYYRKHTARDASCLFRAVSEQIFHTQVLHMDVRMACVDYMKRHRNMFVESLNEDYLNNLQDPKEYPGQLEMEAMSLLYNHDFLVFTEVGKNPINVTNNGFKNTIMVYCSQDNHYDSVYLRSFIADAAFCQSLIYEIVYKRVFRMGDEVDVAVKKMLHDKAYAKLRKDSTASMDSNYGSPDFALDQEIEEVEDGDCKEKANDCASEIRAALDKGFIPFPYKVAKALDSEIYRNVEFDVWNEAKKDEAIFEPGVKCLVRLSKNDAETYHAHIQEMSPEKGPVTVYIVELGEKQTVNYESLEPLPPSYNKDRGKGKKKLFKKTKYKDLQFAIPIPGGRGLPPRLQPQQSLYETSIVPMGRGRGIQYQSVPRNPGPHLKWISPVAQNQRYRPRSNGGRYFIQPGNGSPENHNQIYENKRPYNHSALTSPPPLQKAVNSASTTVTWVKSIGSVASPPSTYQPVATTSNILNNNGICPNAGKLDVSLPPAPPGAIQILSSGVHPSKCNEPEEIHLPYPSSSGICHVNAPSTPPHSSPVIHTLSHSPLSHPSYVASPQPVSIYPCQYYQGMYVPFEAPGQPVNYSVPRSQDPNGSDLPMQDLATLRFFFNLGCDCFRGVVIPIPPAAQYAMLNYGNQPAYSGYLTPMSSTDGFEAMEDSTSTSATGLSPTESTNEHERGPFDDLYEPSYVYGSSPVGFVPATAMYTAMDYGAPVPGVVGEFKNGLVLNEQGVLALSSAPCTSSPIQDPTLRRSNSCESSHSQCSIPSASEGHGAAYKNSGSKAASNYLPPRFQRRTVSPQKQQTSPYRSQPVIQMGIAPGQSPFPIMPVSNPLVAASPPSVHGMYPNGSMGNAALIASPSYYSPPHPPILYPTTFLPAQ